MTQRKKKAAPRPRARRSPPATLVLLSTLKPWARNYNRGDIAAIVKSIEQFGFNGTLRVWRDGTVVAGNHALKALRQMHKAGAPPPEHVTAKGDDWLVPTTSVAHLDHAQAQAFAIADNRTRDLAETDEALLAELLQEVAAQDPALFEATGFTDDDVARILRDLEDDDGSEEEEEPASDGPTRYSIVITCQSQEHQRETYAKLTDDGYVCKAVAE